MVMMVIINMDVSEIYPNDMLEIVPSPPPPHQWDWEVSNQNKQRTGWFNL
jgi:hypothetical protein